MDEDGFVNLVEFPNYGVDNCGRVKNLKTGKILKQTLNKTGYYFVNIKPNGRGTGKTLRVHREVAKAFLPNPENLPVVNHLNGVKTDNKVSNLSWCSHKENTNHAKNLGLLEEGRLKRKKLTEEDERFILDNYIKGCKVCGSLPLSIKFNVSQSTVQTLLAKGKT